MGTGLDPRAHKIDDFQSRLSHQYFDITNITNNDPLAEVEKIYLGISLLRQRFRDVRWISENVVELLKDFGKGREMREIKRFVRSFESIDDGKVTYGNIPFTWWEEQYQNIENEQPLLKKWRDYPKISPEAFKEKEKKLIEIIG